MAMGDDCIEAHVGPDAEVREFFELLGFPVEVGSTNSVEGLEFCSSRFRKEGKGYVSTPERWSRTLYRLLTKFGKVKPDDVVQFLEEVRHLHLPTEPFWALLETEEL